MNVLLYNYLNALSPLEIFLAHNVSNANSKRDGLLECDARYTSVLVGDYL